MSSDLDNPSWSRFQEAQRRLNLVKTHAHEIMGVKREQVHMVVESFSRPGTYDITVHDSGRVSTTNWAPPVFEDAFVEVPAPEQVSDDETQEAEAESETEEEAEFEAESEEELLVSEAVEEVPLAPESAAAPRRRGRPKRA
jgi:hypothetical protein